MMLVTTEHLGGVAGRLNVAADTVATAACLDGLVTEPVECAHEEEAAKHAGI